MKYFISSLEGGPSKFDAEVDEGVIHFLLKQNPDAEDELEMNIYKNQDPLSLDHLAWHLPKCKVLLRV